MRYFFVNVYFFYLIKDLKIQILAYLNNETCIIKNIYENTHNNNIIESRNKIITHRKVIIIEIYDEHIFREMLKNLNMLNNNIEYIAIDFKKIIGAEQIGSIMQFSVKLNTDIKIFVYLINLNSLSSNSEDMLIELNRDLYTFLSKHKAKIISIFI